MKQNLHFDFQKNCPSGIRNGPWYKTILCSQLRGLVFEDYFTTPKRDKYNLMCSIEAHKNKKISQREKNLLITRKVVVVPEYFHQIQQKKH